MRVLHVITSLQTGGAETLVVNMLSRIRYFGYEVGLVIFNGERTSLVERLEQECPECRIYSLGNSFYNPWYIVKLMRIMQKYDIIHTHNSSPQLFAAIANVFCHKKLVTTEHSTNNRKRERGGLFRMVDKWMYHRYNQVVCISEIAEEKLKTYLDNNVNNIITINNGVDVNAIYNAQPIGELKTKKFVVVMVAGFREAKDQDTLIRAMSKLSPDMYELWLVGDGVRKENLQKLTISLHLTNCVRFLGLRTDIPNILKTADLIVMSSHWEGLSLSNIEGMSAGKPFVGSDVDGIREVTKGYGVLFPHEDAEALAMIIQKLHDDETYYKEVSDRCYERAKGYDIQRMVENYVRLYQNDES